ncbi:MAG: hypothetical protein LIO69_02740 [Oscillospiraceae bacterium]|nr:hypothetical protein [Oscillospiraceae bacterium]
MELKAFAEPTRETFKKLKELEKQFEDYLVNFDEDGYDGKLVADAPESARKAQEEWDHLLRITM